MSSDVSNKNQKYLGVIWIIILRFVELLVVGNELVAEEFGIFLCCAN